METSFTTDDTPMWRDATHIVLSPLDPRVETTIFLLFIVCKFIARRVYSFVIKCVLSRPNNNNDTDERHFIGRWIFAGAFWSERETFLREIDLHLTRWLEFCIFGFSSLRIFAGENWNRKLVISSRYEFGSIIGRFQRASLIVREQQDD